MNFARVPQSCPAVLRQAVARRFTDIRLPVETADDFDDLFWQDFFHGNLVLGVFHVHEITYIRWWTPDKKP